MFFDAQTIVITSLGRVKVSRALSHFCFYFAVSFLALSFWLTRVSATLVGADLLMTAFSIVSSIFCHASAHQLPRLWSETEVSYHFT